MSERLLLVEDEVDAREALARGLTRHGFTCVEAGSFAEGVTQGELGFDVAVVDIVLGKGGEGGLDLLARLRAMAPVSPIVVMTAFADVGKVKRALNEGAAFLLEKPFTVNDLAAVLRRVLADRAGLGAFVDRALSHARLTEKEAAVARLLLKGLPTAEIARLEGNAEKTVRQHVSQIYAKCGVASRAEFFHHVFPS